MKLRPSLSIFSSTTITQPPTPSPPPPPLSDTTTTTTTTEYSPSTLTLSISHIPLPISTVKLLAIHNHRLYTTTDNLIHVIHTSSFTLLDTFKLPGPVKSIAFTNRQIYTAHHDNKIRIWKLIKHKHIATLPTFKDRLLRSVIPNNYVNVRRHRKKLWIQHYDVVSGLAFITNQLLLCSASWDKCLKIWRTSDFKCMQSIKAHDDAINAVIVSPDGVIFTGSADRKIKLWGQRQQFGEKYELIATLDKHNCCVNALALNDDGLVLFSGGSDGGILVWDRVHGSNGVVLSKVLRGHCKAVLCLINVCDLLFSGSADRTVRIWQRGYEGKVFCLRVLDGYERPVRSLVVDYYCESSVRVFSESSNGGIRLIIVKGLSVSESVLIHV